MKLYICAGVDNTRPELLTFMGGLDSKLRQKLIVEFAMLASTPLGLLGEPHVKHFSLEKYRGLYELRAKGKAMVRIIFTQMDGKLLLLFPFEKKQSRDTEKALESALKVLAEVREGRRETMELPVRELEAMVCCRSG